MKTKRRMKRFLRLAEQAYEEYGMLVFSALILFVGVFLGMSCFDIPDIFCVLVAMLPSLIFTLIALRIKKQNIFFVKAVEFITFQDLTETKRIYHNHGQ